MKLNNFLPTVMISVFDAANNDNEVFIIEQWAQDSLLVVEENLVAANLVHRDFENMLARKGETVTAWIPGEFIAKRKTDDDDVVVQQAESFPIAVKLNQHIHVSFTLKDGEESKSYKKLRDIYLTPACKAVAKRIDEIVLSQVYKFLGNAVGGVGVTLDSDTLVDACTKLDDLLVPTENRVMIVTSAAKGRLLKDPAIKNAEKSGDGGRALRSGELGSDISGFQVYMSQGTPSIKKAAADFAAGAADGAASAGDLTVNYDGLSADYADGSWVLITGDDVPRQVASHTYTTGAGIITLETALESDVADDAVIYFMGTGAINNGAGYAIEYAKEMTVDGFSKSPRAGQMITIGSNVYAAVGAPSLTSVELDVPLEAAVSDNDDVNLGSFGEFSLGFDKNAIALVTRPLAAPAKGSGALSYVAIYNDLAMRVTVTYNGVSQGHLVTVDMLCGVKTLNSDLGTVVLG